MIRTLLTTLLAAGALAAQSSSFVVPASATNAPGNASFGFPFSYTGYTRLQQAIGTSHFTGPKVLFGMALRPRSFPTSVIEVQVQGMDVRLSDCARPLNALDTTYGNNVGANVALVFSGSFNIRRPNPQDGLEFSLLIPFSQLYVHANTAPLLIDLAPTSFQNLPCGSGGNGTAFDFVNNDPNMAIMYGKNGQCGLPTANGNPGTGGYVLRFYDQDQMLPYGKACRAASGRPVIASTGGAPGIGNSSFAITLLAPGLTAGTAALLFARESAVFGGLSLPAELGFIGAPDCFLETDVALVFSLPVGGGNAVAGLPIPASPGLIGQAFSAQWVFPDAGANALGLGFSQGGRMVIR